MKNQICLSLAAWTIISFCHIGAAFANGSYTVNVDTIYDAKTRLTWQKVHGGEIRRTWQEALAYCEGLYHGDYADWRLPNIRELITIVDENRFNPAINPVFQCLSSPYWSSTTGRYHVGAWGVHFLYGDDYRSIKEYFYNVRCVRGGFKNN